MRSFVEALEAGRREAEELGTYQMVDKIGPKW
jgi:hypothetical protein